jgi:CHAD domain-containing protein
VSDEREVKLEAWPGFRLPSLDGAFDGLETVVHVPEQFRTVYFDTPDLAVSRWGCSLRYREGQGWTVKLPIGEEGDVLVRAEHVFPGDAGHVPVEAIDLLTAYLRGAEPRPVAELRTVRQRVDILDGDGRSVGEVVDDEVSVMDGPRVAARFREVEVEERPAASSEAIAAVVSRLRESGAGPVSNIPKNLRALGPQASAPPDVVAPPLDEDATLGDVIRAALASTVIRLMRHDAGVRIGGDPEDVHQARVATRRMRSDLRTFRDFLEPEWNVSLREELGWLGRELGAVRDAEVLLDRLRSRAERFPTDDAPVAERLLRGLVQTREEARAQLLEGMRSARYADLLGRLVDAARAPSILEEHTGRPATEVLGSVMERPWQHLRDATDELGPDSPDEALHAARIRAKRVRYAAEAIAPVFGKTARSFARAAVALQDALGEHQDAVVAGAWLRGVTTGGPRVAFVAGELATLERLAADDARRAWPKAWKALSRKRLRFWT